ncbi:tetratricopeptide repeat protein [Metabacillus iocasae]|uniref:Tetratricopeptide (TPR) repeat protein n=1 Tax=Priestia iocasae TaxID=2291674 RepID=A0ABS2QQ37_9BACI|nr:tetratricopeptide repeat protein [Metabacillus iocasae]MBM7701328.1 tetratricopeptide (TPR) repeat protein [Metabacillus iocasae]
MDKRNAKKVVAFPNLKVRLIEKATEYMQQKKFHEALPLFSQAYELDELNAEALLGMVICHFELHELEEAKTYSHKMLQEDVGDYYHNLQVHLMILIQLGEYEEGYKMLEAVIQEEQLPAEHAEQFYRLLQFCKARIHEEEIPDEQDEAEQLNQLQTLVAENDIHKQMEMIQSLKHVRLEKHLVLLKELLVHKTIHPIIKTLAVKTLMEEKVDVDLQVCKFDRSIKVNPIHLNEMMPYPLAIKVENKLKERLEQDNPMLLEVAIELWHRHLFLLFPFLPIQQDENLLTASIHYISLHLQGEEIEVETIGDLYDVNLSSLKQLVSDIQELEEISFL